MYLFETMKLENGHIARLTFHKQRMSQSSNKLNIAFNELDWDRLIQSIQAEYSEGSYRLKVMLQEEGNFDYLVAPLTSKSHFTASLVREHANTSHLMKINKTSNREHVSYDLNTDLALIFDENGKILEFNIGNVMFKENDHYFTPHYNEDFLLGCMRQSLIDEDCMQERDYYVDELIEKLKTKKVEVFLLNSLREVADVTIYL